MKAVFLALSPRESCDLLNGDLSVLARKRFPSDYVGWVYIYCTKKEPYARRYVHNDKWGTLEYIKSNGKVVARFWCDKVEEIIYGITHDTRNCPKEDQEFDLQTETLNDKELKEQSCLSYNELHNYFEKEFNTSDNYFKTVFGKAIHIAKLEIFDKPKEISEFWTSNYNKGAMCDNEPQFPCTKCPNTGALYCNCKFLLNGSCSCISLTRAPRNYCYIEI